MKSQHLELNGLNTVEKEGHFFEVTICVRLSSMIPISWSITIELTNTHFLTCLVDVMSQDDDCVLKDP